MGSTAILLANSTWLTWQHSYLMSRGVWPLLLVRCFVLLLFLSTLRLQKLGDIIHSGTVVYDSKWSSYRFEWRNCKKYEKKKWNTFFENRPKNEFKILPSPPWLIEKNIFSFTKAWSHFDTIISCPLWNMTWILHIGKFVINHSLSVKIIIR